MADQIDRLEDEILVALIEDPWVTTGYEDSIEFSSPKLEWVGVADTIESLAKEVQSARTRIQELEGLVAEVRQFVDTDILLWEDLTVLRTKLDKAVTQ